jgi:hypothetical protein
MQSTQYPGSQPAESSSLDFLDGPVKQEVTTAEQEFAQLYVEVFQNNAQGARLLKQWEDGVFWKMTPTDASVQRYAADEALRQFIRGIRGQIKLVLQARSAR